MLFEDREKETMAPKEIPITFRCDEDFRDWLGRESVAMSMSVSDMVRASLLLALPQIKAIRGIDRIQLEDMRDLEKIP